MCLDYFIYSPFGSFCVHDTLFLVGVLGGQVYNKKKKEFFLEI